MKKLTALLLTVLLAVGISACGAQEAAEPTVAATAAPTEATAPSVQAEQTAETEAPAGGHKILVAYFSATHTTQGVAERLADGLTADLYEIVPAEPYTTADLNYHDNNSRTTLETNDTSIRPAISGSVENMEQYDVIFLGYPIWWGDAPRIMSTFVESYDFTGKTVVPFCTSGGSGVGDSASNLEKLAGSGTWLSGRRFSGSDSQEKLLSWVNDLNILG